MCCSTPMISILLGHHCHKFGIFLQFTISTSVLDGPNLCSFALVRAPQDSLSSWNLRCNRRELGRLMMLMFVVTFGGRMFDVFWFESFRLSCKTCGWAQSSSQLKPAQAKVAADHHEAIQEPNNTTRKNKRLTDISR